MAGGSGLVPHLALRELSREDWWAARDSETRVAVNSGAKGRLIHWVKRCWIQPAADTLQLPSFSAGGPGTVPSGAGCEPLTYYAIGL